MAKFRKKPVVIDAVEFIYSQEGLDALRDFCGNSLGNFGKPRHPEAKGWAEIRTLEDGDEFSQVETARHVATEGDWIIKGVKGEFYACKPDIFEATYESVEVKA